MANNNGDILVSIKATDDTAQAVRTVTDQLKNFTQVLEQQAKASMSGATGAAEFKKSLEDVQKTVQTLIAQKAALQDFGIKEDKLSQLKSALDELKRAREFMLSGMGGDQKDWTAEQRKAVNGLQSEINKAERAVRSASLAYERSEAQLNKMGVSIQNIARTQASLTDAIIAGSNALQAARPADEQFIANKAKAAQYIQHFTELLKGQEAAVKAAANAEAKSDQEFAGRQQAQEAAARRREADAKQSMDAARAIKGPNRLADVEAAFAADRANSFQNRALEAQNQANAARAQALAAGPSTRSQSQISDTVASNLGDLGRSGGAQTIDATSASVDALDASMKRGKISAQQYHSAMEQIYAAQKQLETKAGLIDSFNAATKASGQARGEFEKAAGEVNRLAAELKKAGPDAEKLAVELTRAEQVLAREAQSLERATAAQAKADMALKAAKVDTTDLAGETAKLIEVSEKLRTTQEKVGSKSDGTIFGLSPYQFHNLQYRIEDVITQLSLGQSVMQTFESQAGKTLKVFELTTADLYKFLLGLAPAAIALGGLALAFKQLYEQQEGVRQFTAQLEATVDAAHYSATALFDQVKTIQHYGASFKEATEAVKEFVHAGIAPERIAQFGRVAQDVADIFGKSLPDAAKEVTSAFTGGYEAIHRLDEQYDFLTADQSKMLREMIESGHALEAQSMAFDLFRSKLQSAEKDGVSPLTRSIRELRASWDELLTSLANSKALTNVIDNFNVLLRLGMTMTGQMSKTDFNTFMGAGQGNTPTPQQYEMGRLQAERTDLRTKLGAAGTNQGPASVEGAGLPISSAYSDKDRQDMQVRLRELDAKIADLQKQLAPTAVNPGVSPDFASLRDKVADQVGLDREALARVQNVEGVMKDGKWQNSSAGAVGPMQLLPGTFDDMKRKYADVTGNINDVFSNLVAGAHYLKEQLAARGGDLSDAYVAYHDGPNARSGDGRRDRSGSAAAQQAINAQRAGGSIAGYQGRALGGGGGASPDGARLQAESTEQLKKSSEDFAHALNLETEAQRRRDLYGEEARAQIEREVQSYQKSLQEKAAADRAYGPDAQLAIERAVDNKRALLMDQLEKRENALNERRIAQQEAVANAAREAAAKAASFDKTNAAGARQAIEEVFAKYEDAIQKAERAGLSSANGQTFTQIREQLDAAKQLQLAEASIKADEASVNDLLKQRKILTDGILDNLKKGAISAGEAWKQLNDTMAKTAPAIQAAAKRGTDDLSKLPQSDQTRAGIAKLNDEGSGGTTASTSEASTVLTTGFKRLSDFQSIRQNARSTEQSLVSQGNESQNQADLNLSKVYAETHDAAVKTIKDLSDLIDQMKAVGAISATTWSKYHEQLVKAQEDTVFVSDAQKQMVKTIENDIGKGATAAFESVSKTLAGMVTGTARFKDLLPGIAKAFSDMAASILKDIAEIILKQQIMNLLQSSGVGKWLGSATGALSGAADTASAGASAASDAGTAVSAFDSAGVAALFHSGGLVGGGSTNTTRRVDMSMFDYARRYHTGGTVGLANNEVPAVLQRGEQVISASDARSGAANQSSGSGQKQGVRNVLAVGDKEIAAAMNSSHGEQVVLNMLRRNAPTVKQYIG